VLDEEQAFGPAARQRREPLDVGERPDAASRFQVIGDHRVDVGEDSLVAFLVHMLDRDLHAAAGVGHHAEDRIFISGA